MNTPKQLPTYTDCLYHICGREYQEQRNELIAHFMELKKSVDSFSLYDAFVKEHGKELSISRANDIHGAMDVFIRTLVPLLGMIDKYSESELTEIITQKIITITPGSRNLMYVRYLLVNTDLGAQRPMIETLVEGFFGDIKEMPRMSDPMLYTREEVQQATWIVMRTKETDHS